jgi:hypothetical protein
MRNVRCEGGVGGGGGEQKGKRWYQIFVLHFHQLFHVATKTVRGEGREREKWKVAKGTLRNKGANL